MRPFGLIREKRWTGADLWTVILFGKPIEILWHWNDRVRQNSRAYLSIGWGQGDDQWAVLFQHYRQGYEFESHTDGPKSNRVLTLVLNRPRAGGEFFCEGPAKKWLGGRVLSFDGGKVRHGVTRIESGSRSVLMFQRGRWK